MNNYIAELEFGWGDGLDGWDAEYSFGSGYGDGSFADGNGNGNGDGDNNLNLWKR